MKIKQTVSKILANKWVLNIVAIIALINVVGYMIAGNINNVLFFVILGILVRCFSKNMIIVLGIPIIIVNLFAMKTYKEGLENADTSNEKKHSKTTKKIETKPLPTTAEINDKTTTSTSGVVASNVNETFEVGRDKRKSKIDYASTIEDAYDDLNNILGGGGVKQLTQDTQHLMKQQLDLAKSMEAMTPLIQGILPVAQQAQSLLKNMDTSGSGLGNIVELAKKFSGGGLGGGSSVTSTN